MRHSEVCEFVVLFHHIAGDKGCHYVQIVDIFGNPCGLEVEKRLVACEFGVALRVRHKNHGERPCVFGAWVDCNLRVGFDDL